MSLETARRDIEKRLTTNWATTVIAFDNVDFKPPAGDTPWIRLSIYEDDVQRKNIGTPGIHRSIGTIAIEVYTPVGKGTRTARLYVDTLSEIFRDVQFNGITCREAVPKVIGEYEGWWQMNVTFAFYYDGRYG